MIDYKKVYLIENILKLKKYYKIIIEFNDEIKFTIFKDDISTLVTFSGDDLNFLDQLISFTNNLLYYIKEKGKKND